ncbi:SAM-dependent DNA methyltransferase, partial [Staphylococcus cohnii]
VDMRFVLDNLTVLVETKQNFDNEKIEDVYEQLSAYVTYEKKLTNNKIVAILANVNDDRIRVWYGDKITISDEFLDVKQTKLKSMKEYKDLYFSTDNDKIKVMQNTYKLNETLYTLGINEKIRSQFVGTCLLALKNDLVYKGLNTQQITVGLETILSKLLKNDIERAEKLAILKTKVLESQDIR